MYVDLGDLPWLLAWLVPLLIGWGALWYITGVQRERARVERESKWNRTRPVPLMRQTPKLKQ